MHNFAKSAFQQKIFARHHFPAISKRNREPLTKDQKHTEDYLIVIEKNKEYL